MYYVLMEAAEQQQSQGSPYQFLITMGLMFAIIYLLIFRPQRKRQKKHQEMISNVKINDTVITNGGIIGKIVNIKKEKNIVVVRIDDTTKTKIELQRTAIAGVINEETKG